MQFLVCLPEAISQYFYVVQQSRVLGLYFLEVLEYLCSECKEVCGRNVTILYRLAKEEKSKNVRARTHEN